MIITPKLPVSQIAKHQPPVQTVSWNGRKVAYIIIGATIVIYIIAKCVEQLFGRRPPPPPRSYGHRSHVASSLPSSASVAMDDDLTLPAAFKELQINPATDLRCDYQGLKNIGIWSDTDLYALGLHRRTFNNVKRFADNPVLFPLGEFSDVMSAFARFVSQEPCPPDIQQKVVQQCMALKELLQKYAIVLEGLDAFEATLNGQVDNWKDKIAELQELLKPLRIQLAFRFVKNRLVAEIDLLSLIPLEHRGKLAALVQIKAALSAAALTQTQLKQWCQQFIDSEREIRLAILRGYVNQPNLTKAWENIRAAGIHILSSYLTKNADADPFQIGAIWGV